MSDTQAWPSSNHELADRAVEATRLRVNEMSWEWAGNELAAESEAVLPKTRMRMGDPGE